MVDAESIRERLARLAPLLKQLDDVHSLGLDAYLTNEILRTGTERRLQMAEQICLDIGAHVLSEIDAKPADDYGEIFTSLAHAGWLDPDLAQRLVPVARQRNVLVNLYLEVDDGKVFATLGRLDDFRAFAAAVQRLLDEQSAA